MFSQNILVNTDVDWFRVSKWVLNQRDNQLPRGRANENINVDLVDKIYHHDDGSDDENAERRGAGLWKEKLGDQQVGAACISSCLGIRRWKERYIGLYCNISKYIDIEIYWYLLEKCASKQEVGD